VDQELDRIAFHFIAPAIDALFKLGTRQDRAWACQQRLQQRELAIRELLGRAARQGGLPGRQVQRDAAIAEHR
jgi:hypothetical protein